MDRQHGIMQMCCANHQAAHAETDQIHWLISPANFFRELCAKLFKGNHAGCAVTKNFGGPTFLTDRAKEFFEPPGAAEDAIEQ